MKPTSMNVFVFLVGIFLWGSAQPQIIPEDGAGLQPKIIREDGSIISIQQVPRIQEDGERSRSQGVSREALRERLDSIILVLSRLSDRMVSIDTKQNQQNERIDNINYRITKLDVQEEEKKGQFSEVWSALRHRLQASDRELEQISSLVEVMKLEISSILSKTNEMNNKIESLKSDEGSTFDRERKGPKLQAILGAIFGVKAVTDLIRNNVQSIAQNISEISNNSKIFEVFEDSMATKQDLHLGLSGIKEEIEDYKLPLQSCSTTRESRNKKGESSDCWELLHKKGKTKSGVYLIQPTTSSRPFFVYCDMETEGGGWTVIQRREDGTEDFKRDWRDYKLGFGNLAGEFWMGNEKLFQMTNDQVNELRIEVTDFSQTLATASYSAFAIGTESEGYALRLLSGYSGNAGDSLRYHVGQKWSTYDMDNDAWPDQNCARDHTGAWWYKSCDTSNLNGMYLHGPVPPGDEYKGIYWYDFHGPQYSLWRSVMMIRRGGHTVEKNISVPLRMKHSPNIPHPLDSTT